MTSRVLVSLRIRATPERAFQAFTEEVDAWWRPDAFFAFTPKSPGVPAFEPGLGGRFMEVLPGGRVFEIGRITHWEPGARLAFTWRHATFSADQSTEVDVRFEPAPEGVRVTVEHRGWDGVPVGHVARHGLADPPFVLRLGRYWRGLLDAVAIAAASGRPRADAGPE